MIMKNCSNCKNHTWGDEWWNCTPECHGCRYTKEQGEEVPSNWKPLPITIAERIRRADDVELTNRIYELYVLMSEFGHYELAEQFCDCKAECAGGEDCNEDRLKACILRWLQRSVEEDAK